MMSDKLKRRVLLLGGLAALPGVILADDLLCGRRLCRRCGIPPYPYPMNQFSNPANATSLRAISSRARQVNESAAEVPVELDRTGLRLKSFQISERFLRIDHCELSLITVTLANDGNWYLTMVARQDPAIVETKLRPQFERFRRNRFRLEVNPVVLLAVAQTATDAALGKPELPEIPTQEFWVEKGETIRIQRHGRTLDLEKYFDLVEQVDVHFSYQ